MLSVTYFNSREEAEKMIKAAVDFGYKVAAVDGSNPMVPGKWIVQLGLSPVLQGLLPRLFLFRKADGSSLVSTAGQVQD